MSSDKLSIVIPVCNAGKIITSTYECFRQSFPLAQIILVDDLSDDKTPEIIQGFKEKDKVVETVILKKKAGQHLAMFIGLHYASGDVIVTTDDDLSVKPEDFKKAIQLYHNNNAEVVVLTYPKTRNGAGSRLFNLIYRKVMGLNRNGSNHKVFSANLLPFVLPHFSKNLFFDTLLLDAAAEVGFLDVDFKKANESRYSYLSKVRFALRIVSHYLTYHTSTFFYSKNGKINQSKSLLSEYTYE